jgi:hypothetical protein
VSAAQEIALWALLAIAPGNRISAYDPIHNTFYTVEAYKFEADYLWADKQTILDVRSWGKNKPYQQTVVKYKQDVLAPLKPPKRLVESYDGSGNLLESNWTP